MISGLNKLFPADGIGYLMSTYTRHPDGTDEAYTQAKEIAADFFAAGLVVFAPVAYSHGITKEWRRMYNNSRGSYDYIASHECWMPICERFYTRCDYGIVAMTPGWHESEGIGIELLALVNGGIPVFFYDPNEEHLYNVGEVPAKWGDELAHLIRIATERGVPHYMTATEEAQNVALVEAINAAVRDLKSEGESDDVAGD